MRSRGPDGAGLWISNNRQIGMAHRRLSVIDLSDNASQPMATMDGRFRIVFNGEIYNYRALRNELEAKGHEFLSFSDTEVLLHLYAEKGRDMVDDLRGMYAFAIWDEARHGLFLARDPFGIKPLYFHDDNHVFRCASQVKALLAGGGFDARTEPAGHVGFFLWGSVPEPFTLYRGIFSLPAGHTLWIDDNGPRAPRRYFDLPAELAEAALKPIDATALEALRAALRDSVRHHLIADVPAGVFLSGGIDSAAVTALASDETDALHAITLGFEEYRHTVRDEVPFARIVAERYGCEHQVSWIRRHHFDKELDGLLEAMDQPTTDGVNTYFVARAAAQAGLKVALSGLGGDELLGGDPAFRQIPGLVSRTRFLSTLPGFGKAFRLFSAPLLHKMSSPKYASLFEYGGSYGGAYLLRRSLFMPWELPDILDPDLVKEGWETLQPIILLDDLTTDLPGPHAKISALELTHYVRNTLLRDSDWAGMAHSLEIRVPLVDVVLFRALAPYLAASGVPPLKEEMAQVPSPIMEEMVVNRPKTEFSLPVQEWIESAGFDKERGLRGWAKRVHQSFESSPSMRADPSKRILALVSDAFGSGGGIAKFNRDLLTAISGSSNVSSVVAATRLQSSQPKGLPLKLHYDIRGVGGKRAYVLEVIRLLRKYRQFDLVLCGHINLLPIAFLIGRLKQVQVWCVIHGIDAWQPRRSHLVNWMVRRTDGFLAVSETTKGRFLDWSGVSAERVFLLSNCYDPVQFGPGPKSKTLLDRYGLHGKTVLMTLGRLAGYERYKGFDEILEGLPALAEQVPSITYLIVGDGDDRQRLEEKAADLGVAGRTVFAGYVLEDEKADHYRLADAYVMPGRGEGFGIVYLEAMACGIPVVGSKLDGSRDALQNGRLGILADPTNAQDVQEAVLRALAQARGKIPDGLEDFSLGVFRRRTHQYLKQMLSIEVPEN